MKKENSAVTKESADTKWSGFKPVPYHLDYQKAMALKLSRIDPKNEEKKAEPISIKEILEELDLEHIQEVSGFGDVEVKTAKGTSTYRGEPFANSVLTLVLRLLSKSAHPFSCQLYWFDSDSCMEDPHETYHFFIVKEDKIVEENIGFSEYHCSGFDPTLFVHYDEPKVWMHEKDWGEARRRYWYKKFYAETTTGQLMLLRPDKPSLFDGSESEDDGIEEEDGATDIQSQIHSINGSLKLIILILSIICIRLLFK